MELNLQTCKFLNKPPLFISEPNLRKSSLLSYKNTQHYL